MSDEAFQKFMVEAYAVSLRTTSTVQTLIAGTLEVMRFPEHIHSGMVPNNLQPCRTAT
jgi:hypothetical protein